MSPPEHLRAYVTASRARQGLPPTIQDPATLERAAAAFRAMAGDETRLPVQRRRRRTTGEATPA